MYTALENHLPSLLVIIMIYIDYVKKYNTNHYQRFIFLRILLFAIIALASSLCYNLFAIRINEKYLNIVYMMKKGSISASGKHVELIKSNADYRELHASSLGVIQDHNETIDKEQEQHQEQLHNEQQTAITDNEVHG